MTQQLTASGPDKILFMAQAAHGQVDALDQSARYEIQRSERILPGAFQHIDAVMVGSTKGAKLTASFVTAARKEQIEAVHSFKDPFVDGGETPKSVFDKLPGAGTVLVVASPNFIKDFVKAILPRDEVKLAFAGRDTTSPGSAILVEKNQIGAYSLIATAVHPIMQAVVPDHLRTDRPKVDTTAIQKNGGTAPGPSANRPS